MRKKYFLTILTIFILFLVSLVNSQSFYEKVLLDGNGHVYVVAQKNCPADSDVVVGKYNVADGSQIWVYQSKLPGSTFLKTAILINILVVRFLT